MSNTLKYLHKLLQDLKSKNEYFNYLDFLRLFRIFSSFYLSQNDISDIL